MKKMTVFFAVVMFFISGCQPTENQIQTAIAQTQSILPKPIHTSAPTNTPRPTRTVVPTKTPVPTNTKMLVIPADARASFYIGGNESPILPDGEKEVLSVIAIGKFDGVILPIVVRNNTDKSVTRISVSAEARSSEGELLAVGKDQMFSPNLVQPGEISLGYIFFESVDSFPEDVQFKFLIASKDSKSTTFENIRDLEVVEQNWVDNRIVGMLKNPYNILVNGPIEVNAMCFNENGEVLAHYSDFATVDQVEAGGTIPFQVSIYDQKPCPIFLVASFGFE